MQHSAFAGEKAARTRLWFWLMAALLALLFLFAVLKWTGRPEPPLSSSPEIQDLRVEVSR